MDLVLIKYDPDKGMDLFKIKGDINNVVKQKLLNIVKEEWDPENKELMVFGDYLELEFDLPLTPQLYDRLSKFNMRKEGKVAIVQVPYFVITFPKYSYPDSPQIVYMIVPFIDNERLEEYKQMVKQLASEKIAEREQS